MISSNFSEYLCLQNLPFTKQITQQEIFCVKSLTLKIQQVFGVKCLPEE